MKPFRFNRRQGSSSPLGKAVAVAAVLLVGLLGYLSADPEAHEYFHPCSGHCDHECVVTSFAAGEGLFTVPLIGVKPIAAIVQRVHLQARESALESPEFLLLPICGPPLAA